MGAYENPAMIQDRSGEIFAQGIKEFSAGISKGIQDYGAALNAAAEQRRKNIAANGAGQTKRITAAAKAGNDAMGEVDLVVPVATGGVVNMMVEPLNNLITEQGKKVYQTAEANSLNPTADGSSKVLEQI